jgi:uncharacterized membrane protein YphA (DoxX/SURF4 family)
VIAVAQGSSVLSGGWAPPEWVIASLLILVGTMLIVGVLTPFAGLTAALISVLSGFSWVAFSPSASPDWAGRLFFLIVSCAIVLMGPGAFSVDAYFFGRREIVIPRESHAE